MQKTAGTWISVGVAAVICFGIAVMGRVNLSRSVPREVKTLTLEPQILTNSVICAGRLEYGMSYTISADIPIRVNDLKVNPGDVVELGQPLLTLETVSSGETVEAVDIETEIRAAVSNVLGSDISSGNEISQIVSIGENGVQELKSPCNGVVTAIDVGITDIKSAGSVLLTIAEPDSIRMKAALPENYVQDVNVGMDATITGEAFRERSYEGTVLQIMPCAYRNVSLNGGGDTVVDVLIQLDEPDEALRAGYTARASIVCDCDESAILIPYQAVLQDDTGEYVMILENGRAVRRDIETGLELSDTVEVKRGLKAGDCLILENAEAGEKVAEKMVNADEFEG